MKLLSVPIKIIKTPPTQDGSMIDISQCETVIVDGYIVADDICFIFPSHHSPYMTVIQTKSGSPIVVERECSEVAKQIEAL